MASKRSNIDFEKVASRLIAKAEAALEKEAESYDGILEESIAVLKTMIDGKEYDDAIRVAYSIKGAAGSLGWPLASSAAGYLHHVLEKKEKVKRFNETVTVHLHTLDLIYNNQMKGENAEGIKLIKNLYSLLVKYDITPT